jgi:hypothetical protein
MPDATFERQEAGQPDARAPAAAVFAGPAKTSGWDVQTLVDRWRFAWFALVALLLIVSFNGRWQVGPDSAAYRQLGHNLATTGRYFFREDVPGLDAYHNQQGTRYPGLPLLIALLERQFGRGDLAPLLMMQFLSVLTLVVIYQLMLLRLERWLAVCVVVGVGSNPRFLQYANEILSDVPFLLGAMLVLWGQQLLVRSGQRRPARVATAGLAFVLVGMLWAAAMRPTFWLLAAAVAAAAVLGIVTGRAEISRQPPTPNATATATARAVRRGSTATIFASVLAGALFLVSIDIRLKPSGGGGAATSGGYEARMADKLLHFRQKVLARLPINVGELLENAIPTAVLGYRCGPGFITFGEHRIGWASVFSVAIIFSGVALVKRNALWGLWVLIAVTGLAIGPIPRYFLMILPMLLAGWGLLVCGVARGFQSAAAAQWTKRIGLGFVLFSNVITSILFIVVQHGYTVGVDERHRWQGFRHVGFLNAYEYGKWSGVYDLADLVRHGCGPNDKIIGPEATVLTYLSDRQVYPLTVQLNSGPGSALYRAGLFPVAGNQPTPFEGDAHRMRELLSSGRIGKGRALAAGPVAGYELCELMIAPNGADREDGSAVPGKREGPPP